MTLSWDDIVAIYLSQPWWVWPAGLFVAWLSLRWLVIWVRAYAERLVITNTGFKQCRVRIHYPTATITLPRGDAFPVSSIRGVRWENFRRSGYFHAYVEIDDLKKPLHPVLFSTAAGPEAFALRLRSVVERARGSTFSVRNSDRLEMAGTVRVAG